MVKNTHFTALLTGRGKIKFHCKIQFMPANHSITNILSPKFSYPLKTSENNAPNNFYKPLTPQSLRISDHLWNSLCRQSGKLTELRHKTH